MTTQRAELTALKDPQVPVQARLAAAWTAFMFLYIYVDYLGLYKPGVVQDILDGVVWEFDISQTFAVSALASVAIPIVMIPLYIPYSAFNLAGGEWLYYYGLGLVLELVILAFILRSAWTWPRTPSGSTPDSAAPHPSQIQTGR